MASCRCVGSHEGRGQAPDLAIVRLLKTTTTYTVCVNEITSLGASTDRILIVYRDRASMILHPDSEELLA